MDQGHRKLKLENSNNKEDEVNAKIKLVKTKLRKIMGTGPSVPSSRAIHQNILLRLLTSGRVRFSFQTYIAYELATNVRRNKLRMMYYFRK